MNADMSLSHIGMVTMSVPSRWRVVQVAVLDVTHVHVHNTVNNATFNMSQLMSYIHSLLIIVCSLFLLSSCSDRKPNANSMPSDNNVTEIQSHFSDSKFISSIIDSISYSGIEINDSCVIRNIEKIVKSGDDFIILDAKQAQIAVVNKTSGKCRFMINSIGQGPEEYLEIGAFCADDSAIYIVDNMRARLMQFSLHDGKFVSAKKMPLVADDMVTLRDGGFMFASVPLGSKMTLLPSYHRIFVTNEELEIKESIFPYEEDGHDPIGQRFYLSRNGDEIIFGSLMTNGFTIFSEDNLSVPKSIGMKFDKPVTKDTHLDEIRDYQHISTVPIGAGKYYFISFTDGKGKMKYGVWDSDNNDFMTNDRTEGKTMGMIIGSYDNNMIGIIRSEELYNEMVEHGFPKAPDNVENILQNDGYMLIIYHLAQTKITH